MVSVVLVLLLLPWLFHGQRCTSCEFTFATTAVVLQLECVISAVMRLERLPFWTRAHACTANNVLILFGVASRQPDHPCCCCGYAYYFVVLLVGVFFFPLCAPLFGSHGTI